MDDNASPGDAEARPDPAAISQPIEDIVERWWEDHFPGSPVAQVTAAWNHAFAAKEQLKRRLVNLVQGVL
jgi:hypothetical protein